MATYSFEGDYRRKPAQSLGGASKNVMKDELLQRTQNERRKREEQRQKISSSVKIQSFYRGAKDREIMRDQARHDFDEVHANIIAGQQSFNNELVLASLIRPLILCYKADKDADRMTWLCQQVIRDQSLVGKLIIKQPDTGMYQIQKLLAICCSHLQEAMCMAGSTQAITAPLRMMEIYTSLQPYKICGENRSTTVLHSMLQHLIDKGYYGCMRLLMEKRVPTSVERSSHPPTPLAGSILELICRPLEALAHCKENTEFRDATLCSLCREFFCQPYTEQIHNFLLPALATSRTPQFPFISLLQSLLPSGVIARVFASHEDRSYIHGIDSSLTVEPSPWLLCAVLTLGEKHIGHLDGDNLMLYLLVLYRLVPQLRDPSAHILGFDANDDDDDDDIMETNEMTAIGDVRQECLKRLDAPDHVRTLVQRCCHHPDPTTLTAVCTVCHTLMAYNKSLLHNTRLLCSLAYNQQFLKKLWYVCANVSADTVTGNQLTLLSMVSRGMDMSPADIDRIIPLLSVFSSLLSYFLFSMNDAEFYGDERKLASGMPFTLPELVLMSQALRDACLGIIELAHPETRPAIREDYLRAFQSVGVTSLNMAQSAQELHQSLETWAYLFKVVCRLVKQLFTRDMHRQFCPEGHWLSKQLNIQHNKPSQIFRAQSAFVKRPFGALSALNAHRQFDEEGPPLSTMEVRNLTILTEIPFVVPFEERVKIFQRLVQQDRVDHQTEISQFVGGPHISIMVRRNYLYEDAFEKLSPENAPNLRLKIKVQLVNFAGLDEAGIDGGGLFREFMTELVKTAFNPNRGFFKVTQDGLLYPNPEARKLYADTFQQHYYFMGRILGKAVYENLLVELPYANFFISKILSRDRAADVDIHQLQSLDPEVYRHLLSLKNYEGDVSDLGLDFTVTNSDLGEIQVEELKAGGRDIPVTNSNRIEYIYLMAHYRLNRQMRAQVNAFRQGLADVLNLEWLRMFDQREFQTLVSGAEVPIDIEDLRAHTNYSGEYNDQHDVILNFWSILSSLTDHQKRLLLKFVTSCSRPPLLGFKELYPAFCIHSGGSEGDRLPSASTCMNLLKLPKFKDRETMREKLLYAIESGTGFELS